MNLVRQNWSKKDIAEFCEYEKQFLGTRKDCEWEQKIVNTKLQCFGKTSSKAKELVKEIKKGNFVNFIDNLEIKNHLESLVVAHLIQYIKDFDLFKKEVEKFADTIDNWASTDTLRFKKKDHEKLYLFSQELLKNKKPFIKRTGLNIYFELVNDEKYVKNIFEVLDSLRLEDEYYVNMCAAWLLAETFSKHRDKTLEYFKHNKTNSFIINKGIQKCRDSFRVSKEDKDLLLEFKK